MRNSLGSFQSVLVLGGSSDIALATVDRLIDSGATSVTLAVRDTEQVKPAATAMRARGVTVEVVHFDACDTQGHADLVDRLFSKDGDYDLIIVAFGLLGPRDQETASPQALLEVAETNYVGAVSIILSIVPWLKKQGHGTLLVLSSVAGERVRQSNFVYGSSKAGLDGFAQGLADTLEGTGIRVLIVRPGFVKSKMTAHMKPMPLSSTPEAVAEAITVGLKRDNLIIWVPGLLRWVMLVLRLIPRRLFRRLAQ